MKKEVWQDICNSAALLSLYSHTFFTLKQIDLSKKDKGRKKLYGVNVGAIDGCRQAGRHYKLMEKKKDLVRHLQLSYTVCVCSHIFFTSTQIDL